MLDTPFLETKGLTFLSVEMFEMNVMTIKYIGGSQSTLSWSCDY